MKHSKQKKLTVPSLLKYSFAGSCLLLFLCALFLILTDLSLQNQPLSLPYTTASGAPAHADFYPGTTKNPDSAFLLATDQDGTAEKSLLQLLLPSGAPVLVTRHANNRPDELQTLEAETALLTAQTSLQDKDLVLIGLHSGGSALLDEIIHGTHSYRALALVAPLLGENRIDEGTIVAGNYYNKNDWINALDTSMVRQPTLLLSSNGDNITTPYGMTLLYNKLSGDQIIHMGGVYRASQNHLTLSVLDGGFHPTSPYHPTLLADLLGFLTLQTDLPLSLGVAVALRGWMQLGLAASLLILVFCTSELTRYHLTDVSYGLASAIKLAQPGQFFLSKLLAWLLTLPIGWLLIWGAGKLTGRTLSFAALFTLILFADSLLSLLLSRWMKQPGVAFFRPVSLQPLKLLLGVLYGAAVPAVLMLLPFSGYTFRFPDSQAFPSLLILSLLSFLWFRLYLGESEQIQDYKSGYTVKLSYTLVMAVPLLLFALLYAIFSGNTAAFACVILLGLLLGATLLSKGIFHLSGSTTVAAFLASAAFQTTAFVLTSF